MKLFSSLVLSTVLVVVLAAGAQSDIGQGYRPEIRLETVEADKETGRVTLKMTVEVWEHVTEIGVKTSGDSSVVPGGLQYVWQTVDGQDTVQLMLSFDIPAYDTIGVMFVIILKSDRKGSWSRTFVVPNKDGNSDTIRLAPHIGDEAYRGGGRYFVRTPDTLMVLKSHPSRSGTMNRHVETPNAKHTPVYPAPDSDAVLGVIHSNGANVTYVDPATLGPIDFYPWMTWISKLAVETDSADSGQSLLRTQIKDAVKHVMQELADDDPFSVLIDMREPDNETVVGELVQDLRFSEIAGYRKATITKITAEALLDAGVVLIPHVSAGRSREQAPGELRQEQSATGDTGETDPSPGQKAGISSQVIWQEGFEDDWRYFNFDRLPLHHRLVTRTT